MRADSQLAINGWRAEMFPPLDLHEKFVCQAWSLGRLYETILVPGLLWKPFKGFRDDTSPRQPCDPRDQLEAVPETHKFQQHEPIIVVPYEGKQLLLEGTFRSLWFERDAGQTGQILVWVPDSKDGEP